MLTDPDSDMRWRLMLERFSGDSGRRLRIEALLSQNVIGGNRELAEAVADCAHLRAVKSGEQLIEQGASDNDMFMILVGSVLVVVNGRTVARRFGGDTVGEMAAIEPSLKRSASVIAAEDAVVAGLSEANLSALGTRFPEMYRRIAKVLARRLEQRNAFVNAKREKTRVFIISSAEALPVARQIQNAFEHDPFLTVVWTDGVFKVANYTLQSLEDEVDQSDFAVAIAHADDLAQVRGVAWPAPRDNVIFELGMFMGRLGKRRAILMEPRDEGVKLPSDLAGITTIAYRYTSGRDAAALIAPACNTLRRHILELGPNN